VVNSQARPGGPDERARINGTQQIPDPPCLSTFKQEGGGPESGAHLSDGPDERARINGDEDHSGPPRLSTFKSRGGGPELWVQLPTAMIAAP
jgi:hypothetical protein